MPSKKKLNKRLQSMSTQLAALQRRGRQTNHPKRKQRRKQTGVVSAPMAVGSVIETPTTPPVVLSGQDWLESVSVPTTVYDGAIVAEIDLSPIGFPGTHLEAVGSGFEKFHFTKLSVDVVPRGPTTIAGGYIAGITPDVAYEVEEGPRAKQSVRALAGAKSAPWWSSVRVTMDNTATEKWYFTNRDGEQSYKTEQGRFYLVVDGPPSNFAGTLTLSLQLNWTARFANPTVNQVHNPKVGTIWTFEKGFTLNRTSAKYAYGPEATDGGYETWHKFWNESHYGVVYSLNPPLQSSAAFNGGTSLNYFQVAKDKDGGWAIGMYSGIGPAFLDFSNPDSPNYLDGQLTLKVSKLQFGRDTQIRPLGVVPGRTPIPPNLSSKSTAGQILEAVEEFEKVNITGN